MRLKSIMKVQLSAVNLNMAINFKRNLKAKSRPLERQKTFPFPKCSPRRNISDEVPPKIQLLDIETKRAEYILWVNYYFHLFGKVQNY